MSFDLSRTLQEAKIEDEGTEVLVKNRLGKVETYTDASGDEQPCVIVMAGAHSRRYAAKRDEQKRRKMSGQTLTEGKWLDDGEELVVACVISWRGIENDGRPLDPTPHNIRSVFAAASWVLRACDEAMNEAANFTKPS